MDSTELQDEELTDEVLQRLSRVGDEEADNVIKKRFQKDKVSDSENGSDIEDYLSQLAKTYFMPASLPFAEDEDMQKLKKDHASTINNSDKRKIAIAHQFFKTHGLMAYLILGFGSLPETYVGKTAAVVLGRTNNLRGENIHLRLLETGHMVLHVMTEGGLTDPGAGGAEIVGKVRLMHAAIRYLIQKEPPQRLQGEKPSDTWSELHKLHWPKEEWGSPINQVEMAYTIMSFSYVVLRGLRDLGIYVTEEEQKAYIYTWNRIGLALGINTNSHLLPDDYQGCEELFERIKKFGQIDPENPEHKDSVEGSIGLTNHLLKYLKDRVSKFPLGWLFKRVPRVGMRILLSEDTAKRLDLTWPPGPRAFVAEWFFWFIRWANFKAQLIFTIFPGTTQIWRGISRRLLDQHWSLPEGHRAFVIPTKLAYEWELASIKKGESE